MLAFLMLCIKMSLKKLLINSVAMKQWQMKMTEVASPLNLSAIHTCINLLSEVHVNRFFSADDICAISYFYFMNSSFFQIIECRYCHDKWDCCGNGKYKIHHFFHNCIGCCITMLWRFTPMVIAVTVRVCSFWLGQLGKLDLWK